MINISKGSNSISFEGKTKRTATMFEYKEESYMTGETYTSYRSKKVMIEITVNKLSDADYDKLEEMLFDITDIGKFNINDERSRRFYMVFSGSEIPLTDYRDDEGNIFWSGTLKFTQ